MKRGKIQRRFVWLGCLSMVCCPLQEALLEESLPKIPLTEASITDLKGTVQVFENETASASPAVIGDLIKDKRILKTGKASRAEIEFKDTSIARLGSNTVFSFDRQSRNLQLQRGAVLIQVLNPDGRCNIVTPAATASILGTAAIVEAHEEGHTDVYLLGTDQEKGMKVSSSTGKAEFLQPGQSATLGGKSKDRFEIKTFDVKEKWETHELGARAGNLRKMDELKHIKEEKLKQKRASEEESQREEKRNKERSRRHRH